jgi:hypothetical protein
MSLVILLLVELVAMILRFGVIAFVYLDGLKNQDHCRGLHPVVGGIVHLSCWAVFGWWTAVLAATARWCCLIYAVWRRDGV